MHYLRTEQVSEWRTEFDGLISRLSAAWSTAIDANVPIPTEVVLALLAEVELATPDLSGADSSRYGWASNLVMHTGCMLSMALDVCIDGGRTPLDALWYFAEQLPYVVRNCIDEDDLLSDQEADRELEWVLDLPSLLVRHPHPRSLLAELEPRFIAWHELSMTSPGSRPAAM
jgi:hypothetical protein